MQLLLQLSVYLCAAGTFLWRQPAIFPMHECISALLERPTAPMLGFLLHCRSDPSPINAIQTCPLVNGRCGAHDKWAGGGRRRRSRNNKNVLQCCSKRPPVVSHICCHPSNTTVSKHFRAFFPNAPPHNRPPQHTFQPPATSPIPLSLMISKPLELKQFKLHTVWHLLLWTTHYVWNIFTTYGLPKSPRRGHISHKRDFLWTIY